MNTKLSITLNSLGQVALRRALFDSAGATDAYSRSSSTAELVAAYEESVMHLGIEDFIGRFSSVMVLRTCAVLKVDSKEALMKKVKDISLQKMLSTLRGILVAKLGDISLIVDIQEGEFSGRI